MQPRHQVLLALSFLAVSGCVFSVGGSDHWGWNSNLAHERTEVIEIPADMLQLQVQTGSGDIHIQGDNNFPRIVAVIREEEPGDGYLELEAGNLQVFSHGAGDVALGTVEVFLASSPDALILSTGSGAVIVDGINVGGELQVASGSGNILVQSLGSPRSVVLGTGSGNVEAISFSCNNLVVDTGSGNVDIRHVDSKDSSFDTGSGNIRLELSSFTFVEADTGSGNVDARGSTVQESSVNTGSGSIRGLR